MTNLNSASSSNVPKRRDFYQHIALPPHYIPRDDLFTDLRGAVLGSNDLALTSALHGMGGIGKSVIARALCDDPAVQTAFPDGILWTSLGQTPDLTARLREWVEALGGMISESAPSTDSLKAALTELLAERACLLVIDDVWDSAHAEAFRVGGPRCHRLLTTRNAEIGQALKADVLHVPVMAEGEAIDLLCRWLGDGSVQQDHAALKGIVDQLGRLPLAIKLAGGLLQNQPLDVGLAGFQASLFTAGESAEAALTYCFSRSIDTLDADERDLYLALAIFKEDEPIPEMAIARLWSGLGGLNAGAAAALLDRLANRALLELVNTPDSRAVVLHDLLREFIGAALTDPIHAHQVLIDAYRQIQTGEGWPTAPDDGYLYTHLAYHLFEAGAHDELYALLTGSREWMDAKFAALAGDGSYVSDLALALRHYTEQDAESVLRTAVLWAGRVGVYRRINSYTPEMLKLMVLIDQHIEKTGRRTREAFNYARLGSTGNSRFSVLLSLHQTLGNVSESLEELLNIGLRDNPEAVDKNLKSLIEALIEAGELAQAEALIEQIQNPEVVVSTQLELASAFLKVKHPQGVHYLKEALALIHHVPIYDYQITLMSDAIRLLVKNKDVDLNSLLDLAVEQIGKINEFLRQIHLLSEINTALKTDGDSRAVVIFEQMYALAVRVVDTEERDHAYHKIAVSQAEVDRLPAALETVQRISDPFEQLRTRVFILRALSQRRDPSAFVLIEQIQTEAALIDDHMSWIGDSLGRALVELGEYERALALATAYVREEDREKRRHEVAWQIVLAKAQLGDFEGCMTLKAPIYRYHSTHFYLTEFIELLVAKDQIELALKIRERYDPTSVGTTHWIAHALAAKGDARAIELFEVLLDSPQSRWGFYDITHGLRFAGSRLAMLGDIERAVQTAGLLHRFEEELAEMFADLIQVLVKLDRIDEALYVVRRADEAQQSRLFIFLAREAARTRNPRAEAMITQSFETAEKMDDLSDRMWLFVSLAESLIELGDHRGLLTLDRALEIAPTLTDLEHQSLVFFSAAELLMNSDQPRALSLLNQALAAALKRDSGEYWEFRLRDIASLFIKMDQPERALEIANHIPEPSRRSNILDDCAVAFVKMGQPERAFQTVVLVKGQYDSESSYVRLAQSFADIGETARAFAIARTLKRDARESIYRYLAELFASQGNIDQALETASQIPEGYRQSTLTAIGQAVLYSGNIERALQLAQDWGNQGLLKSITLQLVKSGQLDQAFSLLPVLTDPGNRHQVLEYVADAMAQQGVLAGPEGAFARYGTDGVEAWSMRAIQWLFPFEAVKSGFFRQTLYEIVRVLSWSDKRWSSLADILNETA